jgi:hypothetical protein
MTALMTSATKGIFSPTPSELRAGRFMRAEDHGADGGGAGDAGAGDGNQDGQGGADASGTDKGGDAGQGNDQSDTSLLGGASGAGAGGEGEAGDGKVQDGEGDGDGAGDGDGDGDDDAEAKALAEADAKVPDAYQLDPIKIGDGDDAQEIEIDTQLLADVTPLLKEAGVTQGAAKKLAPAVVKVQEQVMSRLGNEHAAMKADWEKAARADKDIGGSKIDETLALAGRALDKFGAPSVMKKDEATGQEVETNEFRALLNDTGLGNHPVMLKMFREIGKLVGEDGELIRPDVSPAKNQDRLEVLYPDDVPKK